MKEKILSMTTPTARKEHICAVCGKPIAKGEQYFNVVVRVDGKLTSRKTHYTCHYSEEKPLAPSKVDELAKTKAPVTEGQFKEAVKDDVKMMLEIFSFQENMEVVFTPLIITECAWHYALKAVKMAAERRIPQTIKLSRTVKMLREEYLKEVSIDLDAKHREKFMSETDNFMKECSYDFTILWYTLNQSLKSNAYDLPYLDVRTEAFCAVVMCELLKKHNKRITNLIGERTGNFIDYTNPKTDALRECMEAYIEPAEINLAGHVETALAIFDKNLKKIKFNLT